MPALSLGCRPAPPCLHRYSSVLHFLPFFLLHLLPASAVRHCRPSLYFMPFRMSRDQRRMEQRRKGGCGIRISSPRVFGCRALHISPPHGRSVTLFCRPRNCCCFGLLPFIFAFTIPSPPISISTSTSRRSHKRTSHIHSNVHLSSFPSSSRMWL
ncbi:hypothetical protein L226DRAFT_337729 [Lentinus tigrinus ALCF2SS1-7]|uniref:Secreted protein n=1 Tax=Lentinus tigrinus ALCF2SS1-6 TaxID=1328759 RepID=A0A5C2SGG5_9APHY|nr:hypothetical protein L227DRAFT_30703 [Lentinus tigrinus ALCF2SS1-6]RPD77963.1 hypothetical protein L226DRAFT_337729 [Lentinus tigrinus ALCF2SS1-7]